MRSYATQWLARALMDTEAGKTKTQRRAALERKIGLVNGNGEVWRLFECGHRIAGKAKLDKMLHAWRDCGGSVPEFAKALDLPSAAYDEVVEESAEAFEAFWRKHQHEDTGHLEYDPHAEAYSEAWQMLEKAVIEVEEKTGIMGQDVIWCVTDIARGREQKEYRELMLEHNWKKLISE